MRINGGWVYDVALVKNPTVSVDGVFVGVSVGTSVTVFVADAVLVAAGVSVCVLVGVVVWVLVGVDVLVSVGVSVAVGGTGVGGVSRVGTSKRTVGTAATGVPFPSQLVKSSTIKLNTNSTTK
jgi:hypothetical protein